MLKKLLALSLLIALSFSCDQNEAGQAMFADTLPKSNGGRLDIMVVAEEALWLDTPGDVFRTYFAQPLSGLPQSESIFSVRQVTPKQFNSLLERSRIVVVLQKGPKGFSHNQNKYAKPQEFITFSAPDNAALIALIKEHQAETIEELHYLEMLHLQKRITAKPQAVSQTLSKHNVSMKIPPAYQKYVENENLLVYWNKTIKTQQGIMVYFEPIKDELAIGERIIPLRDSLTQIHIPGDNEGSYMQVEDYIPPVFNNLDIDGRYSIETRGLWRTEGDFMGGGFLSYTIYDDINKQRITLDAFLYAPEINKRNYILELESILRSIEFIN